jgi:hypothetical protein
MAEIAIENPDLAQVASPLLNEPQPSLERETLAARIDAPPTAEHSTVSDEPISAAITTLAVGSSDAVTEAADATKTSDNTLPVPLNVTKLFLDKLVEQEKKLMGPVIEQLNNGASEVFSRCCSPVFKWCEPKLVWIDKNVYIIINFLIVSILLIAFVQTIVHPFFYTKDNNYNPSENQMERLSVQAMKKFMITLEEKSISEITVQDLLKEALPNHLPISFYFKYYLMLPFHLLSSMSSLFYLFLTYLISLVCYIYTGLTSHPVVSLITSIGIREMIKENQEKNEREKNHENKTFLAKVNLGWNFLERIVDPETKEVSGMYFSIRSEAEYKWADILHHDQVMLKKVLDTINNMPLPDDANFKDDELCPPYMVTLDEKKHQIGLSKDLSNLVSCANLKYATKAHQLRQLDPRRSSDKPEDPIFVVTYEKDPKIPLQQTRIWLMVPSELKVLLKYEKEILEKRFFVIPEDRQNWWIRLEALLKWAKAEFDEDGNRRKYGKYISNVINIY